MFFFVNVLFNISCHYLTVQKNIIMWNFKDQYLLSSQNSNALLHCSEINYLEHIRGYLLEMLYYTCWQQWCRRTPGLSNKKSNFLLTFNVALKCFAFKILQIFPDDSQNPWGLFCFNGLNHLLLSFFQYLDGNNI